MLDELKAYELGSDPQFLLWVADRLRYVFKDPSAKPRKIRLIAEKMSEGNPLSFNDREFLKAIAYLLTAVCGDKENDTWVIRLKSIASSVVVEDKLDQSDDMAYCKQCDKLRAEQIFEAMEGYARKHMPVPLSWVQELEELEERLYGAQ